jgi:hypothetical protein
MAVERADRLAEAGPDAVVVDAGGHHENQHLVAVEFPGRHDLELHGLFGRRGVPGGSPRHTCFSERDRAAGFRRFRRDLSPERLAAFGCHWLARLLSLSPPRAVWRDFRICKRLCRGKTPICATIVQKCRDTYLYDYCLTCVFWPSVFCIAREGFRACANSGTLLDLGNGPVNQVLQKKNWQNKALGGEAA